MRLRTIANHILPWRRWRIQAAKEFDDILREAFAFVPDGAITTKRIADGAIVMAPLSEEQKP